MKLKEMMETEVIHYSVFLFCFIYLFFVVVIIFLFRFFLFCCVMGLFLQKARLLSQMKSPSSWKMLTLLCSPSPAPPLVVLSPLSPGGGTAQCSVMTVPTVSLLS